MHIIHSLEQYTHDQATLCAVKHKQLITLYASWKRKTKGGIQVDEITISFKVSSLFDKGSNILYGMSLFS